MSDFKHPVIANARVWLDDDGKHVWQGHDCEDGERVTSILPWPTWHVVGQKVEPSIHCLRCGLHGFFDLVVDAPRHDGDQHGFLAPDSDPANEQRN